MKPNFEQIQVETLEKMRMFIDIAKIVQDMDLDRQRFMAEYQKTQVEIDKLRKQTNYYPWVAIAISLIGFFGYILK